MTVTVHPPTSEWIEGFEKISSHKKSAAHRALGIDKHPIVVFEGIASATPSSQQLMDALQKQALVSSESATIHLKC